MLVNNYQNYTKGIGEHFAMVEMMLHTALLAQHIRLEENEVFQLAQARLAAPVLLELGRAIQSKVVRICI